MTNPTVARKNLRATAWPGFVRPRPPSALLAAAVLGLGVLCSPLSRAVEGVATAAPINHCPAIPVAEMLAPRLAESRDKYLDNCLVCEQNACRFRTMLNANENRICQALYCQPLKINQRVAANLEQGISGYFEYEYALNARGKPVDVRLLSSADNSERRRIVRNITQMLKSRKYLPIRARGQRLRLEGLYGEVNVVEKPSSY